MIVLHLLMLVISGLTSTLVLGLTGRIGIALLHVQAGVRAGVVDGAAHPICTHARLIPIVQQVREPAWSPRHRHAR